MPTWSRSLVALRTCQVLPRPLNISGVYSMVDRARALKSQLARTALQRELAVESWLIALDGQSLEPESQESLTVRNEW